MKQEKITLVLASFLGLFLELSLIRWFPAHIFSIAFFSNVVLIASFLGVGLGFLFSENKRNFFDFFPHILAASACLILILERVSVKLPHHAQAWIWSYYTGNRIYETLPLEISITQLIGLVFALTVIIFIPIGQKIGKLMKELDSLYAYTLNIFGSLLGVIGFGILAIFYAPAYIWFLIIGSIVILITYKEKRFFINLVLMLSVIVTIALIEKDILWSPYYAINLKSSDNKGLLIYVNQLFHQKAVNFQEEPDLYKKYMLPYKWFHPRKVLIVGSGTGNDVWVAQESSALRIDAVEIDPLILMLGKTRHPQFPYNSGKVRVFVDDARSFMHRVSEKYDMIVYGTLDSHAMLSMTSSIRLDNYVYTQEGLREASWLLAPEGVIVLLFSAPTDWMMTRLFETMRAVMGQENTRYVLYQDNRLFNLMIVAGGGVKRGLLINPTMSNILLPLPAKSNIALPKDNWPYLYLRERGIPSLYLAALVVLICISFAAIFLLSPLRRGKIEPIFFLLGCGFLLLETKGVTTFSLLFGSTWIVNAVVFSSILAIALLANWLAMAKRLVNRLWFFACLILSLLFIYFFPLSNLLKFNFFLKVSLAGILVALPILFSSLIFAMMIKTTKDVRISLGSNLLGAVLGGFLEYSSMIWGLNALYIMAIGCYAIAALYPDAIKPPH